MSLGLPADKNTIDNRAGTLVLTLRQVLDQCTTMKAWLDSQTDTQLGTSGIGYQAAEITTLRASFTDLDNLRKVAHGLQAQSPASDFFFNAGKLTGPQ